MYDTKNLQLLGQDQQAQLDGLITKLNQLANDIDDVEHALTDKTNIDDNLAYYYQLIFIRINLLLDLKDIQDKIEEGNDAMNYLKRDQGIAAKLAQIESQKKTQYIKDDDSKSHTFFMITLLINILVLIILGIVTIRLLKS